MKISRSSSGSDEFDRHSHNFLLGATLDLKVTDFGGSSVDEACASVCPGLRYLLLDPSGSLKNNHL